MHIYCEIFFHTEVSLGVSRVGLLAIVFLLLQHIHDDFIQVRNASINNEVDFHYERNWFCVLLSSRFKNEWLWLRLLPGIEKNGRN